MSKIKNALHHMTWKEVEEAFKEDPVILIPLGSMEEHGPHSITGDFLAAEELANRIAQETSAYVVPVIPYGNSEYFRGYPGTISLSSETVQALLSDVVRSLTEHGVTKILFINGHAGNGPSIEQVARKVKREQKIRIGAMNLWQSLSPYFKQQVYGGEDDPSGHGGEPLTSIMTYLFPQFMRMDLLEDEKGIGSWGEFTVDHISKAKVNDIDVSLFFDMEEISPQGVMGNPYNASQERGEAILKEIVRHGKEFVEKLETTNTKVV